MRGENAKLHDLYTVRVIKSRRLKWAGHVARMEESMNTFNILLESPWPLGKPRHRWEDNIRMDLAEELKR